MAKVFNAFGLVSTTSQIPPLAGRKANREAEQWYVWRKVDLQDPKSEIRLAEYKEKSCATKTRTGSNLVPSQSYLLQKGMIEFHRPRRHPKNGMGHE